jgi:hypothetical protein
VVGWLGPIILVSLTASVWWCLSDVYICHWMWLHLVSLEKLTCIEGGP